MTKNQGDRRGLNPRQLEPQSALHRVVSTGYKFCLAVGGHERIRENGAGCTRCGNSEPEFGDAWRSLPIGGAS
jgi:hypothetical protein